MKLVRPILLALVVALATVGAVAWVAQSMFATAFVPAGSIASCEDRLGFHRHNEPGELEGYRNCVDGRAKLFLERDYAETKDLVKVFLTLLSATLVASITFSEKIVDVTKAGLLPLCMMVFCWTLLLIAIVSTGFSLALMAMAAGWAAYYPEVDISDIVFKGGSLLLAGGAAFVFALLALIVAGVASLIQKRKASLAEAAALDATLDAPSL